MKASSARETNDTRSEQRDARRRSRGGQFNFKLSDTERAELRAVCHALGLPDESSTLRFLVKRELRALGLSVTAP